MTTKITGDNIGIGTTSPEGKLHVVNDQGGGTGRIIFDANVSSGYNTKIDATDTGLEFTAQSNSRGFVFKTGSTPAEKMRIDSSGNVGIGTTSPETTLDVVAANTLGSSFTNSTVGQGIRVSQSTYTANNYVSLIEGTYVDSGGGADVRIAAQYTGSGSELIFGTTSSYGQINKEVVRFNSSAHIFSGTTTNFPGAGNTNTGFMLESAGDGKTAFISRSDNVALYLNRNSNGTLLRFNRSGTEEGYINVTTSSVSLVSTSDYRLKENAVSIADGITRVKQLQPKRFNFIADPSTTVDGFMAHEVQTVVPEAAFGEHDAVDAEGNPKYQGLDQSKLVPLLTAALQEAIAKIETLEAKVTALENA